MLTISLPGERPPSWNKFYSGGHWGNRKRIRDEMVLTVRDRLPAAVINQDGYPLTVPVHITIHARFKDHPLDPDNVASKFYIDQLKGWVITDDTLHQIEGVTVYCYIADEPGVEIDIIPQETP